MKGHQVLLGLALGFSLLWVSFLHFRNNLTTDFKPENLPCVHESAVLNQVKSLQQEIQKLEETMGKMMSKGDHIYKGRSPSPKERILLERLEEYTVLHNQILRGEVPPRFVKMPLINGWGNIFQEAISGFLFALITKRAIIFDLSPLNYLPFRDFLEDPPFDAYNIAALRSHAVHQIPKVELACMNFEELESFPVVSFGNVYDWFAPNILVNPHHGDDVLSWLPKTYFKIMFEYLWKPRPSLKNEIQNFVSNYFGKYTIGIQIRHPTSTQQGKTDHKGFPVPPIDLFAETAHRLSLYQEEVSNENVVWFIATQQQSIIQYLTPYYGRDKIVFYNGTIRTTFEKDYEGQKTALITWFILSKANDIITTEASSYGTTAASLAGISPIVCNHHKFCQRKLSPTPCQDLPWLTLNDPNSMDSQPLKCLLEKRMFPHQFVTAEDASCGHHKLQIYFSSEFQESQKEKE